MYLKYDNMHTNGTFNALIYINNHVNSCINCMLSIANFCRIIELNVPIGVYLEGIEPTSLPIMSKAH